MGDQNSGEAMRLQIARTEAILQSSLDAIVSMDHEGRIGEFNPAAERIFGYARADVVGKQLADIMIPERLRQRHQQGLARYLARGGGTIVHQRLELTALRADGSEFPVELAIVPVVGAEPPVFMGFLRDITERKRTEERQHFLSRELEHRSKNLLTVVQTLVSRSITEGHAIADAREILMHRIGALARSQATLVSGGQTGALISEIVRMEFQAFTDRVRVNGPDVLLAPQAAQTFALLVHELATNAIKHGALSSDQGCIEINWRIEHAASGDRLSFHWREIDGPPVGPPTRKGFGRSLIEQVVAAEFATTPALLFELSGITYSFDAPLSALAPAGADVERSIINP